MNVMKKKIIEEMPQETRQSFVKNDLMMVL